MAFVSGRGSRALGILNQLSNQARRALTSKSRYSFNNLTHIDRIHYRPIFYLHNSLFSSRTIPLIDAENVPSQSVAGSPPPRTRRREVNNGDNSENYRNRTFQKPDYRKDFTKRFSTKDRLLKYIDNVVEGGNQVTYKFAVLYLRACGHGMANESNSTKVELLNYLWGEIDNWGIKKDTKLWNTLLATYIDNRHDVDPPLFIKDMWKSNSKPGKSTYALLQKVYALRGDTAGAMKMIEFMMQNDGHLTEEIYAWMVYALALNGQTDGIDEIFATMKSSGIHPGVDTYSLLINAYAVRGEVDDIEKTICEMIEKGFCPTHSTYLEMLEHLAMGGHHELIDNVIERMGDTNFKTLHKDIISLAGRCISNGYYESALKLITIRARDTRSKSLTDTGVRITNTSQRIISTVLDTSEKGFYNQYLQELKGYNQATLPYGSISGLLKTNNVNLKMLNDTINVSTDVDIFSSLKDIKAHMVSNFESSEAVNLILNLVKRGATLDVMHPSIYSIIFQRCTDTDSVKEVLQFVTGLVEENIDIGAYNYTAMLKKLCAYHLPVEFFLFVRLMKERGVEPNDHQYYHMLKMSASTGNGVAAQYCFDRLMDWDDSEYRISWVQSLYELLIKAHCFERRDEGYIEENVFRITSLFDEMIAGGHIPSYTLLGQVITSLSKARAIEQADKIIEKFVLNNDDFGFSKTIHYLRVLVLRQEYTEAEQLFKTLKEDGSVKLYHYHEMMKIGRDSGDTGLVEAYYQDLLDSGMTPDAYTEEMRILTYAKATKPEICVDIIEKYIAEGNNVRYVTMLHVLRELQFTGNIKDASKLISLIEDCHPLEIRMENDNEIQCEIYLVLTLLNAGRFEEASSLLFKESDSYDHLDLSTYKLKKMNQFKKKASSSIKNSFRLEQHIDKERELIHIENIIKFLNMNSTFLTSLDILYLTILDEMDNVERIQSYYKERIYQNIPFPASCLGLFEEIIMKRDIPNFLIKGE